MRMLNDVGNNIKMTTDTKEIFENEIKRLKKFETGCKEDTTLVLSDWERHYSDLRKGILYWKAANVISVDKNFGHPYERIVVAYKIGEKYQCASEENEYSRLSVFFPSRDKKNRLISNPSSPIGHNNLF